MTDIPAVTVGRRQVNPWAALAPNDHRLLGATNRWPSSWAVKP